MLFRVATVPGKHENPRKTSFFKIPPGKSWKLCTFHGNVPGKPGKKYTLRIAWKFTLYITACIYLCKLLFSFMMKNDLLQSIKSSMKEHHNRIAAWLTIITIVT